jgi:hypothetical protein
VGTRYTFRVLHHHKIFLRLCPFLVHFDVLGFDAQDINESSVADVEFVLDTTDISKCYAWGAKSVGMEICVWDDYLEGPNGDVVDMVSTRRLGISLGIGREGFYMGMDSAGMAMVSSHHSISPRNLWAKILYFWKRNHTP